MGSEIVKYQNKFNRIQFNKFNTTQANIFFAIISRLRNQGSNAVTLSYKHLAQLSGVHYGRRVSLFHHELQLTYHKILHLSIYQDNKDRYEEINLFSKFIIDKKRKQCTIVVNPSFTGFLNHLAQQFTRFSLSQYTILRSRYSKALFRLIKMFRMSGNVYLPMKKFRRLLGVPKSYTGDMITRRIITPAKLQLTPLVRGLHIITQRKSSGNRITGYHITFSPEHVPPKIARGIIRSESRKQRHEHMIKNIKMNDWLSPKLKKRALSRIEHKEKKKVKREPIKAFNNILKAAPASDLKYLLKLHKLHSPTVNFSEYQVRKLRKTIRYKIDNGID